jgi:hypothetical protein
MERSLLMRLRILLLLPAGALLWAQPAFSQGTGTISGQVLDVQGGVLPGVTVTVESPSLQGKRSATTLANGDYILPFLPPGDYTITFELTSFKTVTQKVRVAATQSVPLNATLNMATVSETITVVGQAPGDFGQTASVATNFKAELIQNLPTGRRFQSAVELAPNVQTSGPQGGFAISGAMSFQNLFTIDGVVVQDNIRGTPFNLFIEDAIQETTISTAAVSAEYGRFGGGAANAITKSGGNDFSGSFRTTFDNDKWIALTPFSGDHPAAGAPPARKDDVVPTYEATVGGPVVRDKLWFFGAGRFRNVEQALTGASFPKETPPIVGFPYTRAVDEKRYEGKLTFSPNANHTFKGSYINVRTDEDGNSFGTILDSASLVHRQLPQDLYSFNYTGVLSPKFFVEAQYARRKFSFVNSGATSTDPIEGTLLLDRQRGNARYHSPTFCGVCDPEGRDNWSALVKASYFLSTSSLGSHNLVVGLDAFNDQRFSNNHQSGSDYRVYGTTSIIRGTDIFPVFNNDGSTFIRWTPIFESSQGNNFKTLSAFVNDAWRLDQHFTFGVGLRYDKNDGADSIGRTVVKDSALSPRLSLSYDPKGDGVWTLNGSYAKYVTAIANSIGDSSSSGGIPATIDFTYSGPPVNVGNPSNPVSQDDALAILFDWFNANGGTNRPTRGAPSIPGLTSRIDDSLASPNVIEFSAGVSRRLGSRGIVRLDGTYRKFRDFYATRVDLTTGRVTDSTGKNFDLAIIENTNDVKRDYKGISAQISYRAWERLNLGGNYTLSRTTGNFNGETGPSGPVTALINQYPEYLDIAWNAPEGDLLTDVRHRVRAWAVYDVPIPSSAGSLNVSVLQTINSGTPYGAVGPVDTKPFITNPGYVNPPATEDYFFTPRDAFHTDKTVRTDFALNYSHKLGVGKRTELFFRGVVLNLFNRSALSNYAFGTGPLGNDAGCGTGGCINTAVLTNNNTSSIPPFNPFTTEPVEGTNWRLGPSFGQATSRFGYGTPRTLSFSLGLRF